MAKKQYLDLAGVQALWTKICANDNILKASIKDVADAVEILNGSAEVAGSVQNIVNTAIADKVDSTKIQELKDLIDALGSYPDQTALIAQVDTNKDDIADLKTAIEGLKGGVSSEDLAAVEKKATDAATAAAAAKTAADAADEKATEAKTTADAVKAITDALAVDGIEGTTLKDKIDAEIEANFEVIDIDSLNLTWN